MLFAFGVALHLPILNLFAQWKVLPMGMHRVNLCFLKIHTNTRAIYLKNCLNILLMADCWALVIIVLMLLLLLLLLVFSESTVEDVMVKIGPEFVVWDKSWPVVVRTWILKLTSTLFSALLLLAAATELLLAVAATTLLLILTNFVQNHWILREIFKKRDVTFWLGTAVALVDHFSDGFHGPLVFSCNEKAF